MPAIWSLKKIMETRNKIKQQLDVVGEAEAASASGKIQPERCQISYSRTNHELRVIFGYRIHLGMQRHFGYFSADVSWQIYS